MGLFRIGGPPRLGAGGGSEPAPEGQRIDRRDFLAGAGVAVGAGGQKYSGEVPDPEEVRRFSHYFNLPWHEFQPQWAQRFYYLGPLNQTLGTAANSFLAIITPQGPAHTMVLREVRCRFSSKDAAGDNARTFIESVGINIGLQPVLGTPGVQTEGRRPYRSAKTRTDGVIGAGAGLNRIPLAQFVTASYADSAGGTAFTLVATVPLLVVGERGGEIGVVVTKDNTGADDLNGGFGLFAQGWEVRLPEGYQAARF